MRRVLTENGSGLACALFLREKGAAWGATLHTDKLSALLISVMRVPASLSPMAAARGGGTFDGGGGLATEARLNNPRGVAVDRTGNLYIADSSNDRILRVDR